jgi:membrane protease YdiL (CAAX protease family)
MDGALPPAWPLPLTIAVLGCAALMLRPLASLAGVAVIAAVGVLGLLVPLWRAGSSTPASAAPFRPDRLQQAAVVAIGIGAFAYARATALLAPAPASLVAVGSTVVAAVAEEAFFRRFLYGWLYRWGPAVAVAGAAVAFALVHIPAYGVAVIPLNVAAGILLGWQRWAAGGWWAPALTHAVANVLQVSPFPL